MKQIILILATIILGIYIGGSLINGDSTSLRGGAASIVQDAVNAITTYTVSN